MDATIWKQIVDKVIQKTISRDLLWSKSDLGPIGTLSFETSIDEATRLNVWGYEKNYSYELLLTKQAADGLFVERKRVTTKSSSEGIDFRSLFQSAKEQVADIVRELAFNAILDFLDHPTVLDPKTQEVVFPKNQLERSNHLNSLQSGWFMYQEDETILARIRDMTVAGLISWEFSKPEEGDEEFFSASVGDSDDDGYGNLFMSFRVVPSESKTVRKVTYILDLQHEPNFMLDVDIKPTDKLALESWSIASEIHALVSKQVRKDEAEFEEIVRNNIVHEILDSLNGSGK